MTLHTTHKLADLLTEVSKFETSGKLREAEDLVEKILAQLPTHPHVVHLAGLIAYKRGKFPEAMALCKRSVELAPAQPLYFRNICEIYRSVGDIASAQAAASEATTLAPNDPCAWFNSALIEGELLNPTKALDFVDKAISLKPDYTDAKFLRAELNLLFGNPTAAWETYEDRFKLPQAKNMLPQTDKPQWDGKLLQAGQTLLLVADQGFGDCIQFSRYIPLLQHYALRIVAACSSELVPLLSQFRGLARLCTVWQEVGEFDAFVPLSSLPTLLDPTLGAIPSPGGYLQVPDRLRGKWAQRLDQLCPPGRKRVALVWAGRPEHKNDRKRSLPLRAFKPLLDNPDLCLVSVQKGPQAVQTQGASPAATLIDLSPEIDSFLDTGAILQSCDCLVSVDTSVVHLAGALGVATHLLLPFSPDWRWGAEGSKTPWYSSVRIWRQGKPYDWGGTVEGVAEALGKPEGQLNLPGFS